MDTQNEATSGRSSIRFEDGDAYERSMSPWSQRAGDAFLDWLEMPNGLHWLDVGCGTGAFTDLVARRCRPAEIVGIDPQDQQLAVARARSGLPCATFLLGDAVSLPFERHRFDAAAMALVIFFVSDPARGVSEMHRVVRPGGVVAAYAWDVLGGGFPFDPIWQELRAVGAKPNLPPKPHAGSRDVLSDLWTAAGLQDVQTCQLLVSRTFATFEEYWTTSTSVATGSIRPALDAMSADQRACLKERVRARLSVDPAGRVVCCARANAVKGRVQV